MISFLGSVSLQRVARRQRSPMFALLISSLCPSLFICDLVYDNSIYTLYSPTDRQDSLADIRVIDDSINTIITSLPGQVQDARFSVRQTTFKANRLSVSYGLGVAIGTALTIKVMKYFCIFENIKYFGVSGWGGRS